MGDIYEEFFKNWQEKLSKLEGVEAGDPILVVVKLYMYHGPEDKEDRKSYILRPAFFLGLTPFHKVVSKAENTFFEIKVDKHIACWEEQNFNIGACSIMISSLHLPTVHSISDLEWLEDYDLEAPIYSPDEVTRQKQVRDEEEGRKKRDYHLEIVVGHEKIMNYCSSRGKTYIKFYFKAFKLLGVDTMLLSPLSREELLIRTKVLEELGDLLFEERKLTKKIEDIQSQYLGHQKDIEAYSWTPCRIRDEVHAKIKELLAKAMDLDMDIFPWIKVYSDRPGITIDVSEYIEGLCKIFGVSETAGLPVEN